MRRLLLVALLVAGALGLALLRPHRGPQVSPPAPDAPTPVAPAATPTVRPSDRVATRTVQPSPAGPVGGVQREDADRLIAAGQIAEAIEVFRQVVAADPTPKNHGDLGALLYRLTAFDEAAIHLRAAAELDPGNADRWIALANVYYRRVDPGEAWKAEKRARQAEPGLQLGRDAEGMRVRKAEAAPRP